MDNKKIANLQNQIRIQAYTKILEYLKEDYKGLADSQLEYQAEFAILALEKMGFESTILTP